MIRPAVLEDRPHFLRLWSRFMQEQEKAGSHLTANLTNLYFQLDYFEDYVLGRLPGLCLFAQPDDAEEPIALVLGGASSTPADWETDLGKLGTVWGIYVDPEYRGRGIAVKLFVECKRVGLELGFDHIETYVRVNNNHGQRVAAAYGTTAYLQQHIVSLHDPETLNNAAAKEALAREVNNG